jgi:hypothetical protein
MAFIPLYGYQPDLGQTEAFIESLPHPTLKTAGPDLVLDDKAEAFLYEPLMLCMPEWRRGAQGIGSCVGWGWALGVDILASVEIVLKREPETFGGRTLEASVYALSRVEARGRTRAGLSDGSYGAAAAKAVRDWGTLHYGVRYGQTTFTSYSAQREKSWGDTGVPDELEPFAKERTVAEVTLVDSFEAAATAIQNGYPVPVCSMQGFTMNRDPQGFCKPMGRWAHCMLLAGVRWDRPGLLCINSWGASNSGPHYPSSMPKAVQECSFWIDAKVVDSMLAGRDSFTMSGFDGFPPRKIDRWFPTGVFS